MIDKHPQALASAFRKCRGKLLKIKELAITPKMKVKDVDALIEKLATAKAVADSNTMAENVAGQRWYVEQLIEFAGLEEKEMLELEYAYAFADTASEAEMHGALKLLKAA